MTRRHVVVVGASIAGVSAAVGLREHGFDGDITLVDAEPHPPYERPPLSKSLTAAGDLVPIRPDNDYADLGIELLVGVRVVSLNPAERRVTLSDSTEFPADAVVLATGVSARGLGTPGEDYPEVHRLRNAADAGLLARGLSTGDGPLVLVGGGFIGLEMAAVARELGREVTVVEVAPVPLLRALGQECAELVQRLHEAHGVRFLTERTVAEFVGDGTRLTQVVLGAGTRLPASVAIVGAGVVANDELARTAGVACAGGVVVDALGRSSDPWIWAAGDVAVQPHPSLAVPARIEHWDVAMRHGRAVGATLAGVPTVNDETPYFWSDQYGHTIRMYGRARDGDEVVLRADARPESFVAHWLRHGVVVAVAGLDEAKAVGGGKALVERGARVSPEVLADPSIDMRALARTASV